MISTSNNEPLFNNLNNTKISYNVDTKSDKSKCTLFQKYCEEVIGKLTEECVEKFRATTDEEARIKLLYDKAVCIPVNISPNNGKDINIAQQEKNTGNAHFSRKDYNNALKSYNNGIIKCPQDTAPARELLTILISNRSATYFELREYKRVFNDIDYLTEIGNYPSHLQYKIWLRKAKCYDALQNERLSTEAYNEAIESLKHSKLDEKALESKIKEINSSREKENTLPPAKLEVVPAYDLEIFVGGKQYIGAHPNIKFEQDSYQGRFATAAEDIETGTTIVEENPHCAVVGSTHVLTNCQYCCVSVDQPIACPLCGNVVFCCTNCERLANKTFHKVECAVQESIFTSGASVNCSLALRIISQKPFAFFNDKKKILKDFLRDNCKKNVIKKKTYRYDDYDNVFFLCRNENLRKKEHLIHFACMSIYLLRLLKFGNYFPFESKDEVLEDDELYIGSLILRHLQFLQFNAHEISELNNPVEPVVQGVLDCGYENRTVGAALYPTLALFNHSCDPSIVRYNIKNKIVARTIKPIKAGDIIYENYGPLYMTMPVEQRQETLRNNYWFDCLCTPCVELWPMFQELNQYELRIPCQTERCPMVFSMHQDDDPFMICDYCHNVTPMFPHLKGLMALNDILPAAEALFCSKQFEKAMRIYISALEILYKYSKPPHPDIINVQQRVRVCLIHKGNKACDYDMGV